MKYEILFAHVLAYFFLFANDAIRGDSGASSAASAQRSISFPIHSSSSLSASPQRRRLHSASSKRNSATETIHATADRISAPLATDAGFQYFVIINIGGDPSGHGGQNFTVAPDTGSSDLWIPSIDCTTCLNKTHRYDISKSTSATKLEYPFIPHLIYGDATEVTGVLVDDSVSIAASNGKERGLFIPKQEVLSVEKYLSPNTTMLSDGLLGLAHHSSEDVAAGRGASFIASLFQTYPALPHYVSFSLRWRGEGSTIVFGDPNLKQNALPSSVPLSDTKTSISEKDATEAQLEASAVYWGDGYFMKRNRAWYSSVRSIGWSGTGVQVMFDQKDAIHGSPILIDSGTSFSVVRDDVYKTLTDELSARRLCWPDPSSAGRKSTKKGGGGVTPLDSPLVCTCPNSLNWLQTFPSLRVEMIGEGGKPFELCLTGEEYIIEEWGMLGTCTGYLTLQSGPPELPTPVILGMSFMRSFYTIFDVKKGRVGLIRAADSPQPQSTCPIPKKAFQWRFILMWTIAAFIGICVAAGAIIVAKAPSSRRARSGERLLSDRSMSRENVELQRL